jgi:hypothetical protein
MSLARENEVSRPAVTWLKNHVQDFIGIKRARKAAGDHPVISRDGMVDVRAIAAGTWDVVVPILSRQPTESGPILARGRIANEFAVNAVAGFVAYKYGGGWGDGVMIFSGIKAAENGVAKFSGEVFNAAKNSRVVNSFRKPESELPQNDV